MFRDRAAVVAAFVAWISAFDGGGVDPVLVANAGDAGVLEVLAGLRDWPGRLIAVQVVSQDEDPAAAAATLARAHATGRGAATAIVGGWRTSRQERGACSIAGLTASASSAPEWAWPDGTTPRTGWRRPGPRPLVAGADVGAILASLATFPGVGRRLELKGEVDGVVVLDDYGHHPTAMAATFAAVASRYPGRRLWAVYEPLTYHRTAAMLEGFADVLAGADRVAIADIHAGRDPDTTITSPQALADAVNARGRAPATAPGSVESTADWLTPRVQPGDVLVMGGGRSYVIAERLLDNLRGRRAGWPARA